MSIDPNTASDPFFGTTGGTKEDLFFSGTSSPMLTSEEVSRKKPGIMMAIGPDDKGLTDEVVSTMLSQGREGEIRKTLAANKDKADFQFRQQLLANIALSRPNGRLTDAEFREAYGLSQYPENNPATIVEKQSARKIVDTTLLKDNGELYSKAYAQDPEGAYDVVENNQNYLARRKILDNIAEEYSKKAQDQSWVSWGADFAKTLFPMYTGWKQSKFTQGTNRVEATVFSGGAVERELLTLWQIKDPDEFNTAVRSRLEAIAKDNLPLARDLADQLKEFSSSTKAWMNTFSIADAATAGYAIGSKVAGKVGKKAVQELPQQTSVGSGLVSKHGVSDTLGPRPANDVGFKVAPESSPVFDQPSTLHPKGIPTEPVQEGYVRFFHGGYSPPSEGGSRWVSPSKDYAQNYNTGPGESKRVWYVDLKKGSPEEISARAWDKLDEYPGSNTVNTYRSTQLPESVNSNFKEFIDTYKDPPGVYTLNESTRKNVAEVTKERITLTATNDNTPKGRLEEVLRETSRAAASPGSEVHDVVAAAGELLRAIEMAIVIGKVKPDLAENLRMASDDPAYAIKEFLDSSVPSIANPSKSIDSAYDNLKEHARRLKDVLDTNASLAKTALFNTNFVSRIDKTKGYTEAAMAQGRKQVEALYGKSVLNGIVDTKFVSGSQMGTNVDRVEVFLGKNNGLPFNTVNEAIGYSKHLGLSGDSLKVHKEADGSFYLKFEHNVNEADKNLNSVVFTSRNETPVTTLRMLIGKFGSADQSLSKSQNEVRSVATSSQAELHRNAAEIGRTIEKLSSKEQDKLFSLMDKAASVIRTRQNGEKTLGYFYKSPTEFQSAYMSQFGEMPSQKQIHAYFSAIQLYDMDYVAKSINIYKTKAIAGFGETTFSIKQKLPDGTIKVMPTEPMEGRLLDKLPFDKGGDARVLVIDKNGDNILVNLADMDQSLKKYVNELLDNGGAKVTQLYDERSSSVLHDIVGKGSNVDPIRYVVSHDVGFSPLDLKKQLPYNEGGHHIENLNWRIKSANTTPSKKGELYYGESTVSGFVREHEAKNFFSGAEEARKLYNDAVTNAVNGKVDLSSVEASLVKNGMPWSAKTFDQMVKDGAINPKYPLALAKDGMNYHDVVDVGALGLRNDLANPHRPNVEFGTKFTGERGLGTQSYEWGGSNNPAWMPVSTRMIGARDTIRSSVSDTINSHVYTDYMIRSRKEFIEQFGDTVKGGKERLERSSIASFVHPEWNTKVDPVKLSAAKRMHTAVMQLMYSPSELSKSVTSAKDALLNLVYRYGGDKAGDWLEDSVVWKTRDPTRFMRGVAYHTQIGLFNPVQLVLNTQTLAYMSALSPKHAPGAIKDSILLRFAQMNDTPEIFKYLIKKSGYPHFEEMKNELWRSGFADINGTVAHLDDALEPKTFMGKGGRFLDTASIFFRESESGLKRSAYAIAYREWRDANPTAVVDDFVRQQLLGRAKNLNVQMARDSQATWQKGFMSIPTQFLSYNLRMSEQLLQGITLGNGALSRGEAARAIAMNGLLYGIPAGVVGGTLGVWPVGESFRKYVIDNGLDTDADVLSTFLSEGLLQTVSQYSDGNSWNFSDRYAPGNNSVLKDILSGNTSLLDAMIGPSGSVIKNIMKTAAPVVHAIGATMSEDPEADYPLTWEDFVDFSKSVGSFNNATRAYMAYRTGLWYNKNEVAMSQVSGLDAVFASLLGLSPRDASDVFKLQELAKDRATTKGELLKEYNKTLERALNFAGEGNTTQAEYHFKRAKYLLYNADLTVKEKNEVFSNALKNDGTKYDALIYKNMMNEPNQETYQRKLELRNKRLEKENTK